jgi:8-oxo-dGTP diphosphatase
MSYKTLYVVGFLFNRDLTQVVLIKKNRPRWQAGLYNGVGGKIEASDKDYYEAMVREFKEETGKECTRWDLFGYIETTICRVYCFCSIAEDIDSVRSLTDEQVTIWKTYQIDGCNYIIPNLQWLIPMAIWRLKGYQSDKNIESFNLLPYGGHVSEN